MSVNTGYGYGFKSEAERLAEEHKQMEIIRLEGIYSMLAEMGGAKDREHESVAVIGGTKIGVPAHLSDAEASQILAKKADAEQQDFVHVGRYKYKSWDGAVATRKVLTELFGAAVIPTKNNSAVIEVPVDAHGNKITVPWGSLDLAWRDDKIQLELGTYRDEEYGLCFQLVFKGIELYKYELLGLSRMIEDYMEKNSIYKGKSIAFSKHRDQPDFTDPYITDPATVAYASDVWVDLENAIFGRLRTIDVHRDANEPIAQQVLLAGDYGTGKTLALNLTAQKANDQGWTYIQAKAGEDNLAEVRSFAKLYAPAIIGIEDADHMVDIQGDPTGKEISKVLEEFDGASGKGREIGIVMTTNHFDDFPAPMRRPGRLDWVIEIGAWDAEAFERGVRGKFSEEEIGEVDWTAVASEMDGFTPAFIMSVLGKTRSAAIVRTGLAFSPLETSDFLSVASQVRGHYEEFERSKEFEVKDSFYEAQRRFQKDVSQEALAEMVSDGRIVVPNFGPLQLAEAKN